MTTGQPTPLWRCWTRGETGEMCQDCENIDELLQGEHMDQVARYAGAADTAHCGGSQRDDLRHGRQKQQQGVTMTRPDLTYSMLIDHRWS